jgi:DNA polymerase-3 subunit delta
VKPVLATAFLDRPATEPAPRVVVLAGAEPWLREEALRAVLARVEAAGPGAPSLVRIDAKQPEERDRTWAALDEVRSPSLFGEAKVVAIDGAESAEVPGGKDVDPLVHLATAALAGPATGSVLALLTSRAVKGRSAVDADALAAAGAVVVDCRALYDAPGPWESGAAPWENELARWVARRMRALHGKALDLPDAHAAVQRVGADLAALDAALRTLALSLGARPKATAKDVEDVLGMTREEPSWRIADAVLDGDAARAVDLATAAFDRGITDSRGVVVVRPDALFMMMIATLHGSFRKALVAAEALAAGTQPAAAAKAAGVPPFLAEGFLRRARRDPAEMLARHAAFLEAEVGVKGGGVPPRLAFERLVAALVARDPAARQPAARSVPGRP